MENFKIVENIPKGKNESLQKVYQTIESFLNTESSYCQVCTENFPQDRDLYRDFVNISRSKEYKDKLKIRKVNKEIFLVNLKVEGSNGSLRM